MIKDLKSCIIFPFFQGKILSGPFVYTSDIDITKASTEILLDNLVAGSFYSIQYSISLFEGK